MIYRFLILLACFGLTASQTQDVMAFAKPKKVKYAKTEVEKAVGKCVGAVVLGGIAGAILGGKKDRGKGALIGAGVGGVVCAVIMSAAKKKDRIIAAQIAAAQSKRGLFVEKFFDEDGQQATLTARATPAFMVSGDQLRPVRYKAADRTIVESPVLDTAGNECRDVPVEISYPNGNIAGLAPQRTCRTPAGNWMLYSAEKS